MFVSRQKLLSSYDACDTLLSTDLVGVACEL